MRTILATAIVVIHLSVSAGWIPGPAGVSTPVTRATASASSFTAEILGAISPCSGPEYYQVELVGTRKVPGSRMAKGMGVVSFASSPYGIAVSPEGSYLYDVDIQLEKAEAPEGKAFVAWVTTPQLDEVVPIGRLDENLSVKGQVSFNKYLLVITLEPDTEPGEIWSGPVVARGMSRSGFMHTMAGHGPFVAEPCAVYGFR